MAKKAKKLLLVSYYWFPDGGTGMYRISKFAKYLKRLGWEITVLTASQGAHPTDSDFKVVRVKGFKLSALWGSQKSVIKKEAGFNPSVFYQKNPSLKDRLLIWARLNILVPDAKIGWLWSAAKKGISLHKSHQFDAILSTAPPPTTSLVAQKIARSTGLPWIADFRDPWTQIYYYEAFPQGKFAARLNAKLEKSVVKSCDALVCVNDNFFNFEVNQDKYHQIPNGFDPEDFDFKSAPANRNSTKYIIRYMGTLKLNQFSQGLIQALNQLGTLYPDHIQFDFFGRIDPQYREQISNSTTNIEFNFLGLVPHHEAIAKMAEADLLTLIIGSGSKSKLGFSTKLFEYIYTGKPILAIAHEEGAAANIISETKTGFTHNHNDAEGIFQSIEKVMLAINTNKKFLNPQLDKVESFSFEKLSKTLNDVIEKTVKRKHETGRTQ